MNYLAVEFGGTKLQAALGPGDGTLVAKARIRAIPEAGREGICRQIATLVRTFLAEQSLTVRDVAGVGIGFGGPVDARRGIVLTSHQVEGWSGFPLIEWFNKELGLAAVLGNDSDMAGLAEASFGAGRGASPVVYMNIGSGIGGALIVDGRLYTGQGLGAAEIGHLRVLPDGPGKPWRTLESLASGWGMAQAARLAARGNPSSLLVAIAGGDASAITTEHLVEAVRAGDPVASAVWDDAIERIAVAMANVITFAAPAVYVVGGGVSLVGELLFNRLRPALARQMFAPFAGTCRVEPAQLGEDVVLHGALRWASQTFGD